jgi:hypothetical protein
MNLSMFLVFIFFSSVALAAQTSTDCASMNESRLNVDKNLKSKAVVEKRKVIRN